MKKMALSLGLAVLISAAAPASAAVVWTLGPALPSGAQATPDAGTPILYDTTLTDSIPTAKSPYEPYPAAIGDPCTAGCAGNLFTAVQAGGTAVYGTNGGPTFSYLKFMWGSPDTEPATYNVVQFFLNGIAVVVDGVDNVLTGVEAQAGRVAAGDVTTPVGSGFVILTVLGVVYDKIVITASSIAFEYSFLQSGRVDVVPIPAAGFLLFSALGGLLLIGRNRAKGPAVV